MFNQPICQQCGQPIVGQYIVQDGSPYHPQCYTEHVAPRCAWCGRPLAGHYLQAEGKSYHPDCYHDHVLPHCAYCNTPLTGEYLVDAWGTKFCKRHQQEFPACEFCGRLMPPIQQEKVVPGDPRAPQSVRCPICRSRAVENMAQARPLLDEVARWARTQLPAFDGASLRLELCDRATLTRYMHGTSTVRASEPHTLGVTLSTTHTLNGREVRTEVNGIAVLRGLPTPLFQGTVAHELGHAWLTTQGIKGLPPWAEEGFCEMLAYRYYTHLNTAESRHYTGNIERNPNPIYGEGFRRVRATMDRLGYQNYVTTLRATKRPPA